MRAGDGDSRDNGGAMNEEQEELDGLGRPKEPEKPEVGKSVWSIVGFLG